MGLTTLGLSLRYRMPILTAWSTPGAALLITSLNGASMSEAIGAFLLSSLLITLCGADHHAFVPLDHAQKRDFGLPTLEPSRLARKVCAGMQFPCEYHLTGWVQEIYRERALFRPRKPDTVYLLQGIRRDQQPLCQQHGLLLVEILVIEQAGQVGTVRARRGDSRPVFGVFRFLPPDATA